MKRNNKPKKQVNPTAPKKICGLPKTPIFKILKMDLIACEDLQWHAAIHGVAKSQTERLN